jgi:chromosome segregation ATPase
VSVQAKLQQEINELQRQNNMAENEINELYRQNNMAEKTIASLKTDIKVRLFLRACFVLVVSVQAKLGGVKRKLECVVEELSPCLGGKEEHPL